jgi:hypothetical protein
MLTERPRQHMLTLSHHDRDFDVMARITGPSVRWYGSD